MESLSALLIPVLLALPLLKLMLLPVRLLWKLLIHSGCGLVCLWLINSTAGITGLFLPVNGITVLIAGFLGLPGIGLVAALELMA